MPLNSIEAKYPDRERAEAYARKQGGRWYLWEEDGWWRISQKSLPKHITTGVCIVDGATFELHIQS